MTTPAGRGGNGVTAASGVALLDALARRHDPRWDGPGWPEPDSR